MRCSSRQLVVCLLVIGMIGWVCQGELVHQYSFTDGDVGAVDSVGGADGTLVDNATITDNQLVLDGLDDYANLPGGLLSGMSSTTIEAWYAFEANGTWARLFDFGGTNAGGMGVRYLFFTPDGPKADGDWLSRLVISDADPGYNHEELVDWDYSPEPLAACHVTCVYDGDAGAMRIYSNGELVAENTAVTISLTQIDPTFCYIGKSVYPDPYFWGTVDEFRIYDAAISALQIKLNAQLGADVYQDCVLTSMTPVDKKSLVSANPLLQWTADDGITVDHYELYVSTDPNLANPDDTSVLMYGSTGDMEYQVNGLDNETLYYWRVDTVDDGAVVYRGPTLSFTTIGLEPLILTQPKGDIVVDEGGSATFTIEADNVDTYEWVKVGDEATVLSGTNTLEVTGITYETEADYICRVIKAGFDPLDSSMCSTWVKRQIEDWPMDGDSSSALEKGTDGVTTDPNGVYSVGLVGDALTMDGDYLMTVGEIGNFDQITISLWAKFDVVQGGLVNLISTDVFWDNPGSGHLIVNNTQETFLACSGNDPTDSARTVSPNGAGVWDHYVLVYDSLGLTGKLYINGELEVDQVYTVAHPYALGPLAIGGWHNGEVLERVIKGQIDEVKIWNYPLSALEVASMYTDIMTDAKVCFADLVMDTNDDCKVDLLDFQVMVGEWMGCTIVPDCQFELP